MSVLHPSERQQLDQMLYAHQIGDDEEKKLLHFESDEVHLVDQKDFYDERPNNTIFLETSKEQDERVRKNSPFGKLKTWRLIKLIVKSNDDVRQEQFAMQLISQIDQVFKLKKLSLWLRTYEILATGPRCGLIEAISDTLSIDSIKKKMG